MSRDSSSSADINRKGNDIWSLQSAMHAADAIRKCLRDMGDKEEGLLPPGSFPGALAFVGTGLLFTPFRAALLKKAVESGRASKKHISSPSIAARAEAANSPSTKSDLNTQVQHQQGLTSFANLIDLMITPFLAVVAAQVGLVVGTLYGSSYYLERVVTMEENVKHSESGGIGGDDASETVCKALLSGLSGNQEDSKNSQSGETFQDGILETSVPSSAATPQVFESWDPRQQTIDRLFHAIRHCQEKERRKSNAPNQ